MGRPRTAIQIEDRVKHDITGETGIVANISKSNGRVQVMPDAGRKRYIWWEGEQVERLGPPTRDCTRCGEHGHNAMWCPIVEDPNGMAECEPCLQGLHNHCSGTFTRCECASERNHGRRY